MRRVTTMLSIFAIVLLGTTALYAGQPLMWTGSGSGQSYIGYCSDQDFDVWEDVSWEFKAKAFFNKNGEVVKVQWHWTVEGIVFNYDDPSLFLPYKNVVYNEKYDPETGEDRYAGLWALVTVPGYGAVFMDVGLIVFDEDFNVLFEAGKHQWWDANVDGLCQFLAP